jgi:CheY-like chemotaxis protein
MRTILVVDDEFGISEALSALLSDEGYRVFTSPNGKLGLEKLAEVSPDLVIIDFMMPIMDGARMLQAIRRQPERAQLPVVMMSGIAESVVRRECDGYTMFLRKPFDADTVLALIQSLFQA